MLTFNQLTNPDNWSPLNSKHGLRNFKYWSAPLVWYKPIRVWLLPILNFDEFYYFFINKDSFNSLHNYPIFQDIPVLDECHIQQYNWRAYTTNELEDFLP